MFVSMETMNETDKHNLPITSGGISAYQPVLEEFC